MSSDQDEDGENPAFKKVNSIGGIMSSSSKCPVMGSVQRHTAAGAISNRDWWPKQLNLQMLHQNSPLSNPMGENFNYAEEFKKLDLNVLKRTLRY